MNKKKLRDIIRAISDRAGGTAELDALCPFFLSYDSSGRLSVVGCKEITDYGNTEIHFNCSHFAMSVYGTELKISDYSAENTVIYGNIETIAFEREEK